MPIGTIVAALVADSKQWLAGLTVAGTALSDFGNKTGRKTDSINASIRKMVKTFATVAVVKGAINQVSQALERLDKTAKIADRLNIATKALEGLRHAADQTGAGAQTLDMALQRMVRRISEARIGRGEALPAIQELGISLDRIAAARPDEQFRMLADAINAVEDPAKRVRLAMKFFDSEGVKLVNTLAAGREGLDAFQKEAEELGIAMGRDQLAMVEAANDAIDRLGKQWDGIVNQLTVAVAPAIEMVTGLIGGMLGAVRDLAAGLRMWSIEMGLLKDPMESFAGFDERFRDDVRDDSSRRAAGLRFGGRSSVLGRWQGGLTQGALRGSGDGSVQGWQGTQRGFGRLLDALGRIGDATAKVAREEMALAKQREFEVTRRRDLRRMAEAESRRDKLQSAQDAITDAQKRLGQLQRQGPRYEFAAAPGGGGGSAAIMSRIAEFSQPAIKVQDQQLETQKRQLQETIAQKMIQIQMLKALQPQGIP